MAQERLYVCTTCERDRRLGPEERSRGAALADAIEQALAESKGGAKGLVLRRVQCLNGCLSACNVALRAPAKYSLRFSRLEAADAGAVLAFAALYARSPDGDVPEAQWPPVLRGRNTVRVPPLG